MSLTVLLILFGILVFCGFFSVVSGLHRILSVLKLIFDALTAILMELRTPLGQTSRREAEK